MDFINYFCCICKLWSISGAEVDFIDIDQNSGLISIENLKSKLKAKLENKLPKIIIPVHLGGSSCDMKEIFKLSKFMDFQQKMLVMQLEGDMKINQWELQI